MCPLYTEIRLHTSYTNGCMVHLISEVEDRYQVMILSATTYSWRKDKGVRKI